jgi:hypothetical protein
MGESEASHPYRPAPPSAAAVAPRRVPWIVSVNVLAGGWGPRVILFLLIPMTAVFWISPPAGQNVRDVEQMALRVFWLGFVMLPALILFVHVRKRCAELRLLRTGMVAYATLSLVTHDGPSYGDDPELLEKLHFKFEHHGRSYDFMKDTFDSTPLRDDPREQIVFRPGQESRAVLVDSLPGRPRIREDNTIAGCNHVVGAVVALVLLACTVAVNTTGVFFWLR